MAVRHEQFAVTPEEAGHRLDQALSLRFPQVSRAYLQKRIADRSIRVNGKPARKGEILRAGDRIEIDEILEASERRAPANPSLPIRVVFEDEYLAVVEKPPGIPTHPVVHEETDTLLNWWLARNPGLADGFAEPLRAGIVHRLDADTSGLLVLARSPEILEKLQNQFRERTVKKEYLALVWGHPPLSGVIDWPLAHDPKNQRRMVAVRQARDIERLKAKPAKTEYQNERRLPETALLRVRTRTGRMHQVRAHLSALGHPLVGDAIYRRPQPVSAGGLTAPRHFLHAATLDFRHPVTGEALAFTSELPADLRETLARAAREKS